MQHFFPIFCGALVVEALVSYVKLIFVDKKIQWQVITAICIGVFVSFSFGLDLFTDFGMVSYIPYVGTVLTGIIFSRGSNYLFDLVGKLTHYKESGTLESSGD